MIVKILYEGTSDQSGFATLFKEELEQLRKNAITVNDKIDYGGRYKCVKKLPMFINAAFIEEEVDFVIVHIDGERDSEEHIQKNIIDKIKTKIAASLQLKLKFVVIKRNFESVLLSGCFDKDRNFETIHEPKILLKHVFRQYLHTSYIETIHAQEYASKINKDKVIERISGVRDFHQYLISLLQTT